MATQPENGRHRNMPLSFESIFDLYRSFVRGAAEHGIEDTPISIAEFGDLFEALSHDEKIRLLHQLQHGFAASVPDDVQEFAKHVDSVFADELSPATKDLLARLRC